ncbi:zinc finger protein GAI-ASSOCIATED FACTOR 1-like [Pistacia vera]|uniref:zinc finger protein GAI-ASSOCIATED FACTOR 1-like n=1 Tax=Pistacia vera TaxID=55513 RepID=UPI0012632AC1|nr:zinc finger protein GAI-ASSOCIATED FACTOR 1-like [Pistacia vera]XP_031266194.1 zinc finger protein GAI-ASSOCIATED FACTOR 1-like [Pistacia vera]
MVDLENSSTASGEASVSSSGNQNQKQTSNSKSNSIPNSKKKRNLPGMPDPDAEVIALSPKTLMATNRFVCEICSKGFQRDQNLQLHRRGHNLPWKLRQRPTKEVKKRVYVCPELTCVHHDPARALGDLTGIKKHFCRKHGEKKWKCDKCSKKYAVQSDWKAHAKVCGTREYKCDCGTLFSRRDSFITHRAFCDVLAEETRVQTHPQNQSKAGASVKSEAEPKVKQAVDSPTSTAVAPEPATPASAPAHSTCVTTSLVLPTKSSELAENPARSVEETPGTGGLNGSCSSSSSSSSVGTTSSNVFASLFASSTVSGSLQPPQTHAFSDLLRVTARPELPSDLTLSANDPISLCLSTTHGSSVFGNAGQERRQCTLASQPALSATALLQKAAQMGATTSNTSLLRGLGIVSSSTQHDNIQWSQGLGDSENASIAAGLGLGLPSDGGSGLKELMMGTPSGFGPKQPTLDFLGLGMAAGGSSPNSAISSLVPSISGGVDVAPASSSSYGGGEYSSKEMGSGGS